MKRVIAIMIIFNSCGMNNDQIISEAKKCRDAGMEPEIIQNRIDYSVYRVVCLPKVAK